MSQDGFHLEQFDNGLTLLVQSMDHVSSASMIVRVPIRPIFDPPGMEGAAAVGAEWWLRGAGDRDTRQLNDALDSLGCRHGESAGATFMTFSAAQVHQRLPDVLKLYREILLAPRLDDKDFAPSRDLVAQDLASLEDHPAQKANVRCRGRFFPDPLGRYHLGTPESLSAMTADGVRDYLLGHFSSDGAIIAVAGKVDPSEVRDQVADVLAAWPTRPRAEMALGETVGGIEHIAKDTAQTHITLAQPSVVMTDERYYASRVAVCVLSGGMSGRMLTEVREKRGLVYRVSTTYGGLKTHAGWFTYAGTVPEKAQETLEVVVGELRRLGEGIDEEELARAKVQLKSSTIMSMDMTGERVSRMAGDYHYLGHVRTIEELTGTVDAITADDVVDYVRSCPAEGFAGVIVGPEPLDLSVTAS